MPAIAANLPEELVPITDAVEAFCRAEVIARHERHHDLLNDPRNTYGADGKMNATQFQLLMQAIYADVSSLA